MNTPYKRSIMSAVVLISTCGLYCSADTGDQGGNNSPSEPESKPPVSTPPIEVPLASGSSGKIAFGEPDEYGMPRAIVIEDPQGHSIVYTPTRFEKAKFVTHKELSQSTHPLAPEHPLEAVSGEVKMDTDDMKAGTEGEESYKDPEKEDPETIQND